MRIEEGAITSGISVAAGTEPPSFPCNFWITTATVVPDDELFTGIFIRKRRHRRMGQHSEDDIVSLLLASGLANAQRSRWSCCTATTPIINHRQSP
ncbi:MAG: hypothetical protein R3C26_05225 [Calditrichia bacterium]